MRSQGMNCFPYNPTMLEGETPKCRIVCFHGAGSDSSLYTSRNRTNSNILIDYCKENRIEILSVHLPGRTARLQEELLTCFEDAINEIDEEYQKYSKADVFPIPVVLLGHSMGSLLAYEFACLLKIRNIPIVHCIISCTVPPNCAREDRPWSNPELLDDNAFKKECARWDCNPKVFQKDIWGVYGPILRADFQLLDDYDFDNTFISYHYLQNNSIHFWSFHTIKSPLTVFFSENDRYINEEKWGDRWMEFIMELSKNKIVPIIKKIPNANHSYLYDPQLRTYFFKEVIKIIEASDTLNFYKHEHSSRTSIASLDTATPPT